jgi:hypothetical protein|tara:strand:+ start:2682 stop:2981 length:300 start_codon:yes stop_codon:yes gene_type:complete
MPNLADETQAIVRGRDVLYVTDGKVYESYDSFLARAKYIQYDAGYGGHEILLSLKVVGHDWWLQRGEYDGSEWWDAMVAPDKPTSSGIVVIEEEKWYDF